MLVFEFKAYGKLAQLTAVDDAIRTAKFIRNSCIRLWMDVKNIAKNDLQKYCAVLAANFPFANELNSNESRLRLIRNIQARNALAVVKLSGKHYPLEPMFVNVVV
jgi:hypothetical protein